MPAVPIKKLAEQIGIGPEQLLKQLGAAGLEGKDVDGNLDDDERTTLLAYLRGGKATAAKPKPQEKVTLSRRTTTAVKQSSRTGGSRTVHVEVKKRRTYVRRGELQRQQEEVEKEEGLVEIRMKALGGISGVSAGGTTNGIVSAFPDKSIWLVEDRGIRPAAVTYCWVDEDNEPHCKEVKPE